MADLNGEMKTTPRLLLATAAVAAMALVGSVAAASACGTNGYSYAGLGAPTTGDGISAVITPLGLFNIPTVTSPDGSASVGSAKARTGRASGCRSV